MPRPSPRQLIGFAVLFAAFFALSSGLQYWFVRQAQRSAIEETVDGAAANVARALAFRDRVDPARYEKLYLDAYDFMIVLRDGEILDTQFFPQRPIRELLAAVHCPIRIDAAYAAPVTVTYHADTITSETWTIRAKALKGGVAILGFSELDEVSQPEDKLAADLTLFGDTTDDVGRINFSAVSASLHWAIIDDADELLSAHGRLPLRVDAMQLGGHWYDDDELDAGDKTFLASYRPLASTTGAPAGTIIQLSDITLSKAALRHQARFNAVVAAVSVAFFLVLAVFFSSRHEREKRMIREAFQNYFSPPILEAILRDPARLALGGQRREVTVLFADIRSFTSLTETLNPQQLTRLMQEYFEAMTEAVFAEAGIVDKYIGDAMMAFWGAPIEQPDQADRAVRAALAMIARLGALQQKWQAEGLPIFDIGIGINLGIATVGNFGSTKRFDYTLIGDAVNAASRIEALSKEYQSRLLISDSTKNQLTVPVHTRDLGSVQVRGREQAIRLYQVEAEG